MRLRLSLGDNRGGQEHVLDTVTTDLPVRVVLRWGHEAIVVDVFSLIKVIAKKTQEEMFAEGLIEAFDNER